MKKTNSTTTRNYLISIFAVLIVGGTICTWSLMSLVSSLNEVGWNSTGLFEKYMAAATDSVISMPSHNDLTTYTPFFNHLAPILFLGLFPAFFRYINKETKNLSES